MDSNDPSNHKVTPGAISALEDFLSLVDVPEFSKGLRDLLLHFLIHEHEELPSDFGHFIEDIQFLFAFLDRLEGNSFPACKT